MAAENVGPADFCLNPAFGHCVCTCSSIWKERAPPLHLEDVLDEFWEMDFGKDRKAMKNLEKEIKRCIKSKEKIFSPSKAIGYEEWKRIRRFPPSFRDMTEVTTLNIYGSSLIEIPQEIEFLEKLSNFDPYTSYGLHFFPYEMVYISSMQRKNGGDSRISTRALYGNFKHNPQFPEVRNMKLKARKGKGEDIVICSICRTSFPREETVLGWTSRVLGTDRYPLLIRACSTKCVESVEGFHYGGQISPEFTSQYQTAPCAGVPLSDASLNVKPAKRE